MRRKLSKSALRRRRLRGKDSLRKRKLPESNLNKKLLSWLWPRKKRKKQQPLIQTMICKTMKKRFKQPSKTRTSLQLSMM